MPNWCTNNVRLSNDDTTKIDALVKVLEDKERVFNHLYPMPEELKETTAPNRDDAQRELMLEKYGSGDWYEWCVNNWGTKWDADVYSWEREDDNTVYLSFCTAWSPPTDLFDKLVEEGWGVYGTYCEEGCAFVGEYEDGYDNCYAYDGATSETILEYIPEHLDEEYGISENMREWEDEYGDEEQVD